MLPIFHISLCHLLGKFPKIPCFCWFLGMPIQPSLISFLKFTGTYSRAAIAALLTRLKSEEVPVQILHYKEHDKESPWNLSGNI